MLFRWGLASAGLLPLFAAWPWTASPYVLPKARRPGPRRGGREPRRRPRLRRSRPRQARRLPEPPRSPGGRTRRDRADDPLLGRAGAEPARRAHAARARLPDLGAVRRRRGARSGSRPGLRLPRPTRRRRGGRDAVRLRPAPVRRARPRSRRGRKQLAGTRGLSRRQPDGPRLRPGDAAAAAAAPRPRRSRRARTHDRPSVPRPRRGGPRLHLVAGSVGRGGRGTGLLHLLDGPPEPRVRLETRGRGPRRRGRAGPRGRPRAPDRRRVGPRPRRDLEVRVERLRGASAAGCRAGHLRPHARPPQDRGLRARLRRERRPSARAQRHLGGTRGLGPRRARGLFMALDRGVAPPAGGRSATRNGGPIPRRRARA